jgi:tryptophan-rich sensory protein
VAGTIAAALIGGLGSARSGEFYQQLDKPGWAPPGAVFGPVWTVLYLLMAIAAVLVVRRAGWPAARPAMTLFAAQLALNALWPWLFFGSGLGAAALAEIVLLWLVLLLTVRSFAQVHRAAAALLLPYLAWVSFAALLTWAVWRRNPELLADSSAAQRAAALASRRSAGTEQLIIHGVPNRSTQIPNRSAQNVGSRGIVT